MAEPHFPFEFPPMVAPWPEGWPAGPWQQEPLAALAWIDPRTRAPCAMIRNYFGAWCGYAGVPEGHPLHGRPWRGRVQLPLTWIEAFMHRDVDILRDLGLLNVIGMRARDPLTTGMLDLTMVLPAHGGINYAQPDRLGWWWFGFDCHHTNDQSPMLSDPAHFGDHFPALTHTVLREETGGLLDREYRDQPYVTGIVTRLAWAIEDVRQAIEGNVHVG